MGVKLTGLLQITNKVLLGKPLSPPVAEFTANVVTGDFPLIVNFTDTSTNEPTSWLWDFKNDGTATSTLQNPSYTYTDAGTYTVKLTATNAAGSNVVTKTNYITVTIPPGEQVFTTVSLVDWVVPSGVTSISMVGVGGGGGSALISGVAGGQGAVRIIWGTGRSYPSNAA